MFKRWMILLAALFGLSVVVVFYFHKQGQNSYHQFDVCGEYLDSRPSNWTSEGDSYYWDNCDLDNPISELRLAINYRDFASEMATSSLFTSLAIIGLMFVSIVGRWVVKGRPW